MQPETLGRKGNMAGGIDGVFWKLTCRKLL